MVAVAGEAFPSGSQELHVLAVDDSLVDRTVIERLLKLSSCKVTAVESGSRALQYLGLDGDHGSIGLNDLKVNLIMTDYSMPGMTGYELLKRIKESSALREVPVVVMSSENILTRIDRCLEEGAEDFLVKPVKLSDVTRLKDFVMRRKTEGKTDKRVDKRKHESDCACSLRAESPSASLSSAAASSPASPPASLATFVVDPMTSKLPSPSSSLEISLKRPRLETEQ